MQNCPSCKRSVSALASLSAVKQPVIGEQVQLVYRIAKILIKVPQEGRQGTDVFEKDTRMFERLLGVKPSIQQQSIFT